MNLEQVKLERTALTDEQKGVVLTVVKKLSELGHEAKFVPPVKVGPVVSAYRFLPIRKTRVSHLESLADDFAVALGVEDVLVKRMPGDAAVGVFVPNKVRKMVSFRETIGELYRQFHNDEITGIPMNFGVDVLGKPFIEDLVSLPHLLIAGSTGSGKSTLLSSILTGIVYTLNSSGVKLVLSDTKGVEFGHFIGSPHLLFEPATSIYQTLEQMDWLISEMEDRLSSIGKYGCRNIHEYNTKLLKTGDLKDLALVLPYIVLAIDELADLMMHKGDKRGESKIAQDKLSKIVQKSRAAGVYVIAATQRPSVNVVSGSIKANFPARLSFRLPSEHDSRTVLSTGGAEHLLSRGDMLYVSPNRPGLHRLHAPYASIEDIKAAVDMAIRKEEAGHGN